MGEQENKEGREGEGVHDISWLNDQAPTSPDQACASEGDVLGEGELFSGAVEVRDTGENEAPLDTLLVFLEAERIKEDSVGFVEVFGNRGVSSWQGYRFDRWRKEDLIYLHDRSPRITLY